MGELGVRGDDTTHARCEEESKLNDTYGLNI